MTRRRLLFWEITAHLLMLVILILGFLSAIGAKAKNLYTKLRAGAVYVLLWVRRLQQEQALDEKEKSSGPQ